MLAVTVCMTGGRCLLKCLFKNIVVKPENAIGTAACDVFLQVHTHVDVFIFKFSKLLNPIARL